LFEALFEDVLWSICPQNRSFAKQSNAVSQGQTEFKDDGNHQSALIIVKAYFKIRIHESLRNYDGHARTTPSGKAKWL